MKELEAGDSFYNAMDRLACNCPEVANAGLTSIHSIFNINNKILII